MIWSHACNRPAWSPHGRFHCRSCAARTRSWTHGISGKPSGQRPSSGRNSAFPPHRARSPAPPRAWAMPQPALPARTASDHRPARPHPAAGRWMDCAWWSSPPPGPGRWPGAFWPGWGRRWCMSNPPAGSIPGASIIRSSTPAATRATAPATIPGIAAPCSTRKTPTNYPSRSISSSPPPARRWTGCWPKPMSCCATSPPAPWRGWASATTGCKRCGPISSWRKCRPSAPPGPWPPPPPSARRWKWPPAWPA